MPHRLKRPRQLTALIALVFWGLGFLVSRAAEEPGESSTLLIPGSIGVIVLVAINAILSIRVRHRGAALNAGFAAGLAGVAIVAAMYPRIDYAGVPYLLCAAPIVAMIVLAVRNPADSPPRADGAGGEAVGADGAGGEADEAHDNTLSLLGWVAPDRRCRGLRVQLPPDAVPGPRHHRLLRRDAGRVPRPGDLPLRGAGYGPVPVCRGRGGRGCPRARVAARRPEPARGHLDLVPGGDRGAAAGDGAPAPPGRNPRSRGR